MPTESTLPRNECEICEGNRRALNWKWTPVQEWSSPQPDAKALRELCEQLRAALRNAEFSPNGKCPVCWGWGCSEAGETPRMHNAACTTNTALAAADALLGEAK